MKLQFEPDKGLIIVPTKLIGKNGDIIVRLALDTGATKTMINWHILVLLGYDPAAISNRVQMTTGSGVEFVPIIEIEKVDALGIAKLKLPVLCHTLPPSATVDGLLGLDFFSNKKLTIDFRNGKIIVL